MAKYLVIGASSFIGAYTVAALRESGADVVATGRNPRFAKHYAELGVPYVNVELEDPSSFSALGGEGFDAAVSLAALMPANVEKDEAEEDIADYIRVNVLGTLNILEFCRAQGIPRLVDIVSRFDCRLYDTDKVITEETPLRFSYIDDHAAYVVSNNIKGEMLHYYNERYGMDNIWLRIPSIYGVGPHGSFCKDGVVTKSGLQVFIDKASVGEPIQVYGDPDTPKDVLYIKDMAQAIVCALCATGMRGLYNVSYDENFSIFELALAVSEAFAPSDGERSLVESRPDKRNNGGFPRMDNKKIREELGFTPSYDDPLAMMRDYKAELERGVYPALFGVSL